MKGMPRMFNAMTQALKKWYERNIIHWDTGRLTNRDLRDPSTGETKILKVVIPVARLNPDTGGMENWDTWTAAQTFEDNVQIDGTLNVDGAVTVDDITTENVTITAGDRIYFGATEYIDYDVGGEQLRFYVDNVFTMAIRNAPGIYLPRGLSNIVFGDGDSGIQESSDDVLDTTIATNLVQRINAAGVEVTGDLTTTDDVIVGDDLVLPTVGNRIAFGDLDTYIVENTDDNMRYYCGGTWVLTMTPTQFSMRQRIESTQHIRHSPVSSPGALTNWSTCYGKDVAGKNEFHCSDEDGNETQLSSHDPEGYYFHHSTIPKRGIELNIDIERFFRDKYPEYVREAKIDD